MEESKIEEKSEEISDEQILERPATSKKVSFIEIDTTSAKEYEQLPNLV